MITRRDFTRISLVGLGMGLANCSRPSHSSAPEINSSGERTDLVIWWEQGYLPEENEQVTQIVRNWEKQSGLTVNLKLLPVELIEQQLTRLIDEPGNPKLPDIVYSVGVDTSLAPKLAWRDQLLELSALITPKQQLYTDIALAQVSYYNQVKSQRGYYALPLWEADDYIHYWGNLLEEIGFQPLDVPSGWESFWQFWQTAQTRLRSHGHSDIYGVGLCMSPIGFDTYTSFTMFLDAHDVEVVNSDGEFLLQESTNQQKLVRALDEYTRLFLDGFVPPAAVEWTGSGNNSSFLDGRILMTQNLTLSIPLTQKLPVSAYNQDAAQRYQQIVTVGRPNKPDGTALPMRKGIKQAIVPKACLHPEAAQDFLAYLIDPENLNQLINGFKGRVLPVMPQLFKDSLWSTSTDPHLAAALEVYHHPSLPPYEVMHSAFSEVQRQQLWAKMVLKVLQDRASPTEASQWAIDQIKNIWTEWETVV